MAELNPALLQYDDLGRRLAELAYANGLPTIDRFRLHPQSAMLGNAGIAPEFKQISLWNTLTASGSWTGYNGAGGAAAGVPTIAANATTPRTTAVNSLAISWDPTADGVHGKYFEFKIANAVNALNPFRGMGFMRWWHRSDEAMVAGDLEVEMLDGGRNVIGSTIVVPTAYLPSVADVWQVCEIDLSVLRPFIFKTAPVYLRIRHTTSGTGADVYRVFNFDIYRWSNGKGPVTGTVVHCKSDGAYGRGTFVKLVAGNDQKITTGASNSTGVYGVVIKGESATGIENPAFLTPTADTDDVWVQTDGPIYARVATAVSPTLGDPVSLASATTVDDEEAAGQELARFMEAAAASSDGLIYLNGGGGGPGVAFSNVMRDNAINTLEAAFTMTGTIGSGAGNGVDVPITGGEGGATGAGGAITLLGGAGGATSGVGGAINIDAGSAAAGNSAGGVADLDAGDGFGTGAGGQVHIGGGDSGAGATGNGGEVDITSGAAASTDGTGGLVDINGGVGTGTGAGGAIDIDAGDSGGGATGNGGTVTVDSGDSLATDGDGGDINLTSGNGVGTGDGGSVNVTAGTGGATGTGGLLSLLAGDSAGAGGTAGSINIDSGDPAAGTAAPITIGNIFASALTLGAHGKPTTVRGSVLYFDDHFLGTALRPEWTTAQGAACTAALQADGPKGIVDLVINAADDATSHATLHSEEDNFDPALGKIVIEFSLSMSTVATGRVHIGLAQSPASVDSNPPTFIGSWVAAVLDLDTDGNWYLGGDNTAPADTGNTAVVTAARYRLEVATDGVTALYLNETLIYTTLAAATVAGTAMGIFAVVTSTALSAHTVSIDRIQIWQD